MLSMTEYDYSQICKVFLDLDVENCNQLIGLENTYQIFRRFDEFDFLNLLECKIYKNCLSEVQKRVLSVCCYLLDNNKEP